jgi:DMSO/TMAO reductase YedYZ heme-binding membrane subunit
MPLPLRRLVLTLHVATSVGWLGAVIAYLALDIGAAAGTDVPTVRAAYVAMGLIVTYVIVPLALTSVAVGIVNALGTPWGLARHYWVLVKFLMTLLGTAVLLIEAPQVRAMADAAASGTDPRSLPGSLPHSVGGLVVLVLATVLSVYKPRGLTRYGWRRQQAERRRPAPTPA